MIAGVYLVALCRRNEDENKILEFKGPGGTSPEGYSSRERACTSVSARRSWCSIFTYDKNTLVCRYVNKENSKCQRRFCL